MSASGSTYNGTTTSGNDTLVGGSGADTILGGGGNDFLNGGAGNDVLDGGSGFDTVLGGSGTDTLIYRAWENQSKTGVTVMSGDSLVGDAFTGYDLYNGGSGTSKDVDTLVVYLSQSQLSNATFMTAFKAEWAEYQAFITANLNKNTSQAGQAEFTFKTINLKASAFEKAEYKLDPTSPVAKDDSGAAVEKGGAGNQTGGSNASGNVLSGDVNGGVADSDPNGTTLTVSAIRTGAETGTGTSGVVGGSLTGSYGTLTLRADGSYDYVPIDAMVDFLRQDQKVTEVFTYTVRDASGLTDTAQLTITVTGQNDAPVALAVAGEAEEDGAVLTVAADFSDVDMSDTHSFSVDRTGTLGSVTDNGDGTFGYSADGAFEHLAAGKTATDTFTYTVTDANNATSTETVTITVTGQNDAPVALAVAGEAEEDGAVLTVAADFSDVDMSDTHSFSVDRTGTLGSVTDNGDGTFGYSADGAFEHLAAGKTATDTFTYTVTDANNATSTETVTITVTGQNDAPVVAGVGNVVGYSEQAAAAAVASGLTVVDPDSATLSGATVTISAGLQPGDLLNFAPQNGITGSYNAATGVLTLTGTAALANYQATLQSITFSNPSNDDPTVGGAAASRTVTWEVNDGAMSSNAGSTTINVTAINDAPVNTVPTAAQATNSGAPLAISGVTVADADSASLSTTLSVANGRLAVSSGSGATITGNDSGSVTVSGTTAQINTALNGLTYTSNTGFSGADTLRVSTTDSMANDVDTISITVNSTNRAPVATKDTLVISTGTVAVFPAIALLGNDTDADGNKLHIVSVLGGGATYDAATKSITFNTTGLTTQANAASFTYTVSDGIATSTGSVSVDVVNANPSSFSLTSYSAPGSYQASYLDFGGGSDTGTGAGGFDIFVGGTGNDFLVGGDGNDILRGGTGNDTLDGGGVGDVDLIDFSDGTAGIINFVLSQGTNSFFSVNASGAGLGNDTYSNMEGVIGTNFADTLTGSASDDVLMGGGGNDTINGGSGNDEIYGGTGKDTLTGGQGADTFVFIDATESPAGANRDIITDFAKGTDKIDVSGIDANTGLAFDQAFLFQANASPATDPGTVANSITWFQSGGNTIIQADVNGDTTADFQLQLTGLHVLTSSDFIL